MAEDPLPSELNPNSTPTPTPTPISPDDDQEDLEDDIVSDPDDSSYDDDDEPLSQIPPPATTTTTLTPPPPQPPLPPAVTTTATTTVTPRPIDDSRRLFQRLWTDEDEIELLQGFLDYTASRGGVNPSGHHHDTTAFYDQIKNKLQLEFNKNQLVEKLRRLKKKYRNVVSKMSSGKDFVFKSPHDHATFELSRKIWFNLSANYRGGGGGGVGSMAVVEFDDDDKNQNPNANVNAISYNAPRPLNSSYAVSHINLNNSATSGGGGGGYDMSLGNSSGLGKLSTRKRPRIGEKSVKLEGGVVMNNNINNNLNNVSVSSQLQGMVEETVRNCLSPVLKDLINTATNGTAPASGAESPGFKGVVSLALNTGPLNFLGVNVDEKWRKQQIMELEVYSKRLELVQEQIKVSLEELKSMES